MRASSLFSKFHGVPVVVMMICHNNLILSGTGLDVIREHYNFISVTKEGCHFLEGNSFRLWDYNADPNKACSADGNEDLQQGVDVSGVSLEVGCRPMIL